MLMTVLPSQPVTLSYNTLGPPDVPSSHDSHDLAFANLSSSCSKSVTHQGRSPATVNAPELPQSQGCLLENVIDAFGVHSDHESPIGVQVGRR
eukprot:5314133-Amphidinium_carterae.1